MGYFFHDIFHDNTETVKLPAYLRFRPKLGYYTYVNADHDYAMNPGGAWKGDACREPSPLVELSAGLL